MFFVNEIFLTDIKLKALLMECVTAAPGPIVLLQNQDFFPDLGQQHRNTEPTDPAADDDGIQVFGDFTGHKT